MALIDVVKCSMQDNELCKKFHSEDLRIGSQLVVYPSQVAFFVKGGRICDKFETGTYTLTSNNIPLLNKIINIPFGNRSPFQAEVWFINQTSKLDMKWGTPTPIQLEDPKYNIIIPVRAFGQYGLRVVNSELFLRTLIGNMSNFSTDKVDSYFKGKLLSLLNMIVAKKIANDNISILDINTHLIEMSMYCNDAINEYFVRFGLELQDFSIISINIPQDDPSLLKLKEAKDLAAHIKITGREIYQMDRGFDVLEGVANNQGAGGSLAAMGAGLGAGIGMGNAFNTISSNIINQNMVTPPPVSQTPSSYYVYIGGQQIPNQNLQTIKQLIVQGQITQNTLVWTFGMQTWVPIVNVPELAVLFTSPPPVPPTV